MDPSSSKCQFLVCKIILPETSKDEINISFKDKFMRISTIKLYLEYSYPFEIQKDQTKIQWIQDRGILKVIFTPLK